MHLDNATIFALASGAGRAGVAVIRISGPSAGDALLALIAKGKKLPAPRHAVQADLYAAESNSEGEREHIDSGLVLWFPGPKSFTGEDVVELHVHGGQAVLNALMTSLSALPGLRAAEAGEFSRRAFENGKMDLTAVEAIADLVDAETATQRRQALNQMGGALAQQYDGWRERLVKALAFAEANIDFSEEDIPDDLREQSLAALRLLKGEVSAHLSDNRIGERIRGGFRIALTGAPNVGKSSLLNALVKRDAAIVSDIAGTTRDIIEVPLDLGGYSAVLIDTAGIRESTDAIEQEGVRRAEAQAEAADLRVHLIEATSSNAPPDADSKSLVVLNKIDLVSAAPEGGFGISVKTGAGLDRLITEMTRRIAELAEGGNAVSVPLTRARHRGHLVKCADALSRAIDGAETGAAEDLVAEDIRLAAQALGRITGRVDVEELLDNIFRDFCIGK